MTPSAFIFLYENQLFLTFRNRTVAVWNFRGELVTSFEDHLLWHPDCNTNNIYITSDQDLIISYCKVDSIEPISDGIGMFHRHINTLWLIGAIGYNMVYFLSGKTLIKKKNWFLCFLSKLGPFSFLCKDCILVLLPALRFGEQLPMLNASKSSMTQCLQIKVQGLNFAHFGWTLYEMWW